MSSSPAAAAAPVDRTELLAAAEPCGLALLALVRRLVDELEEAAPWSLLFASPLEPCGLRSRVVRLLAIVEQTPRRIVAELDGLSDPGGAAVELAVREEAEFYFGALHQMTASDRRLLSAALDKTPLSAPPSRAEATYLAELAADLKGKYSSAMMGAAAALVSDGRWLGVEVEAALFPEKAEEQARNRDLLAALAAADGALARLRADFPWRSLLESWRAGRPIERAALGALFAIPPAVRRLLALDNRRALFSGDYHLLQRRELLLGSRLHELEALQGVSLGGTVESPAPAEDRLYERLCQLLIELAAVVDVEALGGLIGRDTVLRLHRQRPPAGALPNPVRELDPVAELLGEEDLTLFIRLLYGEVTKRSSIAREVGKAGPAPPPASGSPVHPESTAGGTRPAPRRRRGYEREPKLVEAALAKVLARLTSADNERWRAFQMVAKLHNRLRVLPPTLLAEIEPFLAVLRTDLLPLVEEAAVAGLLPATAPETLRASDRRLSELRPAGLVRHQEVGKDLDRVVRLLSSLTVAVTGGGG